MSAIRVTDNKLYRDIVPRLERDELLRAAPARSRARALVARLLVDPDTKRLRQVAVASDRMSEALVGEESVFGAACARATVFVASDVHVSPVSRALLGEHSDSHGRLATAQCCSLAEASVPQVCLWRLGHVVERGAEVRN